MTVALARDRSAAAGISDRAFQRFQALMKRLTGVHLAPAKRTLVASRLGKRLRELGVSGYDAYLDRVEADAGERQMMVDLLTTHETYFFREPKHFEFIDELVRGRPAPEGGWRIWSAACSSGEEVYTLAMVLAEALGARPWEITGSDVARTSLDQAEQAVYPLKAAQRIPESLLKAYCLKGVGASAGYLQVGQGLRGRCRFRQVNLTEPLRDLPSFDVILLRNVMIYFQPETKAQVIRRLVGQLRPGGFLLVGHSESLSGMHHGLRCVCPAIYQRPA